MKLEIIDRWIAGILDYLAFTLVFIMPVVLIYAFVEIDVIHKISAFLYYICFGLLLSKDVFGSSSLFKKTYGIKIVNNKTGDDVSPIKTVFRNSTIIVLSPLEYILAFFSPKRRIGDLIFNTRLVSTDKMNLKNSWIEIIKTKINSEIIIALIIAQLIGFSSLIIIRKLIELM